MRRCSILTLFSYVVLLVSDASAQPSGSMMVGEWRYKKDKMTIISNESGVYLLDAAPGWNAELSCGDDGFSCSYERDIHTMVFFVLKNSNLLVQVVDKSEDFEFNPRRSYETYKRVPPGIPEGFYNIYFSAEILRRKLNGKKWDPMGDPPDPVVTMTLINEAGQNKIQCKQSDSFVANCLTGQMFFVSSGTKIEISISDNDAVSNDNVGKIERFWPFHSENKIGKPLPVKATGAFSSVVIRLNPSE